MAVDPLKAALIERAKREQAARQQQQPERTLRQRVYDNVIGDPNDGVDSFGERAGRTLNDMGSAAAAGISRGVTGALDLPGMIFGGGGGLIFDQMEKAGVISPAVAEGGRDAMRMGPMGGGDLFSGAASSATGGATEFRGDTTAGRYAGTVGEFLPGAAIGSGGIIGNLLKYGVIPGLASEGAGQATEGTALEPVARVVAPLLAAVGVSAATRPARPRAPDADDLARQAEDLYRAGEARSAVPAAAVDQLRADMDGVLTAASRKTPTGRVTASGNVRSFLDVLDDYAGQPMKPAEIQNMRSYLQDAAKSADAGERRIAMLLMDKFDNFRAQHVPEFQQADRLYQRVQKSKDIDWRVKKAEDRAASTGTGGNAVNAARQNIRQILDDPKKLRGYSQDEIAAMREFVRGTAGINALRNIGRLSPTSGAMPLVGSILAGMGAGATGSPLVIMPTIAGMGAKAAAETATGRQLGLLSEMIRNGAPLPARAQSQAMQGILAALLGANAD